MVVSGYVPIMGRIGKDRVMYDSTKASMADTINHHMDRLGKLSHGIDYWVSEGIGDVESWNSLAGDVWVTKQDSKDLWEGLRFNDLTWTEISAWVKCVDTVCNTYDSLVGVTV